MSQNLIAFGHDEDLRRRQQEHLRQVQESLCQAWRPCAHDSCPYCCGTGIKLGGGMCVHNLYCGCPKCSPQCVMGANCP